MAIPGWELEEQQMFAQLSVGDDETGLRNAIKGQRMINGRLYMAIKLILDALPAPAPGTPEADLLARAREITDGIPGPPPGCDIKGLGVTP